MMSAWRWRSTVVGAPKAGDPPVPSTTSCSVTRPGSTTAQPCTNAASSAVDRPHERRSGWPSSEAAALAIVATSRDGTARQLGDDAWSSRPARGARRRGGRRGRGPGRSARRAEPAGRCSSRTSRPVREAAGRARRLGARRAGPGVARRGSAGRSLPARAATGGTATRTTGRADRRAARRGRRRRPPRRRRGADGPVARGAVAPLLQELGPVGGVAVEQVGDAPGDGEPARAARRRRRGASPGTWTTPDSSAASTVHVSRSTDHGSSTSSGSTSAAAMNRPGNGMSMFAATPRRVAR